MPEIIALFSVLIPHLSATTTRQLSQVVFALLAITGRVTMLNISRWTGQGGSYRTVQRFFNTVIPWTTISWMFFRTYLLDRESAYILVGDETVRAKSGDATYGLSRFFSSLCGKAIPGLSFLALSLVSVIKRSSYSMVMEQIVRSNASSNPNISASEKRDDTEDTSKTETRASKRKSKPEQRRSSVVRYIETTSSDGSDVATTDSRLDPTPLFCA